VRLTLTPTRADHQRHVRKYAEGEIARERSFFFRGPDNRLNLRAHNLALFVQLADGVDDETWVHHLHAGDYSRWFGGALRDPELAAHVAAVEGDRTLSPAESRARVTSAIRERYTLPASSTQPAA
jgi:hypothetical protein